MSDDLEIRVTELEAKVQWLEEREKANNAILLTGIRLHKENRQLRTRLAELEQENKQLRDEVEQLKIVLVAVPEDALPY